MQKRNLLALAAAAAMAMPAVHAQSTAPDSSVQMYGLLGMYLGHVQVSGRPGHVTQLGQGGLVTSYIGFRGSEDLGGGLKAIFALEAWLQPDDGALGRAAADSFFSRNSYVGLQGSLGRLTAGRQTNPTYLSMGQASAFGGSTVFSPLVLQSFIASYGGVVIGDTVWNNTVEYVSPRLRGVTFTGIYGLGEVAGQSGVANLGLHANYSNGPLAAVVSVQRVRTPMTAPVTQQNAYFGGASYDFKVAKLFGALLQTSTEGTRIETHTASAGLRVPVGPGAVMAEWARTRRDAAALTVRNTGSVGYDYFLSKRTDVYVAYVHDRVTGFSAAGTTAVGIRHTF